MTKEKTTEPPLCRRCGGKCYPSKALFNPLCGTPGFPDGILPGATLAPAADAVMIDCLKCEACGHSFTLTPSLPTPDDRRVSGRRQI